MNKLRTQRLADVARAIGEMKAVLESIIEDEENYRDNMPENLHGSKAYEVSENASDNIGEAVAQLEEAVESIESVCGEASDEAKEIPSCPPRYCGTCLPADCRHA